MKLTFLGATEGVTGSKYLLEHKKLRILVDCGLFQGGYKLKEQNKAGIIPSPETLDAVLLTHAHIDHSGYLPALVKSGFKGPIYSTEGTFELCAILLPDSADLQGEEAEFLRKKNIDPHAQPLYTQEEVQKTLSKFRLMNYHTVIPLSEDVTFSFIPAGHIFGAAMIQLHVNQKIFTFSGDLGGFNDFFMRAPDFIPKTDILVMEATYGERAHYEDNPKAHLERVVKRVIKKQGVLIIPAFAVGRTQGILFLLSELKKEKRIPENIPIFIDSPMATDVTKLMCKYKSQHKIGSDENCKVVTHTAEYTRSVEQSMALDKLTGPRIIIASSGMLSGGRVTFHLRKLIEDPKNTLLFTGYQAVGTLGRIIQDGKEKVRIFGQEYKVRLEIDTLHISGHADYLELIYWVDQMHEKPKQIFLTHGDEKAVNSLKKKLEKQFPHTKVIDPQMLESFEL
ncbi:MAG: MBL fold metallo-hydrolase [Alphaproteobacteria bacterium]|nr:MAG: MBL fold metallo-hydrolase [Alphaproteobacteria bacterium]